MGSLVSWYQDVRSMLCKHKKRNEKVHEKMQAEITTFTRYWWLFCGLTHENRTSTRLDLNQVIYLAQRQRENAAALYEISLCSICQLDK